MREMDQVDIGIAEVLVARPRAPWRLVGDTVGVSASTAARRFDALCASGALWMSSYAGAGYGDRYAEIEILVCCVPTRRAEVVAALIEHGPVISLSSVTGDWDLVVNASAIDGHAGVEALLADPVWAHPGIVSRRVSQVTRVFAEGSDWTFGSLSAGQRESLSPDREDQRAHAIDPAVRRGICRMLGQDPRVRASRIAEELSLSVATASRTVEYLLASQAIVVRTEVSAAVAGMPVGLYLYLEVPPARLAAVGSFVAGLGSTRLVESVVHPQWNLACVFWTRTLGEVHEIEAQILGFESGARVVSRATRSREIKRVGWLLDELGRPVRRIPTPF